MNTIDRKEAKQEKKLDRYAEYAMKTIYRLKR
jgi:hypothetical protein